MVSTTCTVLAREKDNRKRLHVIQQKLPELEENQLRLRVDLLGLSANNKFYLDFGEDSTFFFNAAYPLEPHQRRDNKNDEEPTPALVAIPAWGLATVIESTVPEIAIGQKYRGFLHLTDAVQFTVEKSDDGFIVVREKLYNAYNAFTKVSTGPLSAPKESEECGLALTTLPGSLTGFCLSKFLMKHSFYGTNAVVLTSASSKLSLAAAFFLKRTAPQIQRLGWTNTKNKLYCLRTDLYDAVFDYDEMPDTDDNCILVDIAGKFDLYEKNKAKFLKALTVGNTNDIPGGWLNPKLEPYLVFDTLVELTTEFTKEGLDKLLDDAVQMFVDAVIQNQWLSVRLCGDLTSIRQAHIDICDGTVPPSEAVILDMAHATQGDEASP